MLDRIDVHGAFHVKNHCLTTLSRSGWGCVFFGGQRQACRPGRRESSPQGRSQRNSGALIAICERPLALERYVPMPDLSFDTSLSLVQRVRKQDPEAWRRLTTLYGPIIYHWCRQRCGLSDHDAEDLGQEVFASVFRSIDSFDYTEEQGSFRGWLWTVTVNKARDLARRRRSQTSAVGGNDHLEQIERLAASPQPPESDAEERSHIYRPGLELIRPEFSEQSWNAFWRTAIDGQSSHNVGLELGMSAMAVRKAKSRVLARLRTELDGLIDGEIESK